MLRNVFSKKIWTSFKISLHLRLLKANRPDHVFTFSWPNILSLLWDSSMLNRWIPIFPSFMIQRLVMYIIVSYIPPYRCYYLLTLSVDKCCLGHTLPTLPKDIIRHNVLIIFTVFNEVFPEMLVPLYYMCTYVPYMKRNLKSKIYCNKCETKVLHW